MHMRVLTQLSCPRRGCRQPETIARQHDADLVPWYWKDHPLNFAAALGFRGRFFDHGEVLCSLLGGSVDDVRHLR